MEIIFGGLVYFLFFGSIIAWSIYSDIESAAVAPATVQIETKRLTLDRPDGGTIDK